MIASVLTTAFDVFLLLLLMRFGFRKIEAIVIILILTIRVIFEVTWLSRKPRHRCDVGWIRTTTVVSTHASGC